MHRTQSYNEMSARYAPLPDLYFVPTVERLFEKNVANKQANAMKGAEELSLDYANEWLDKLEAFYAHAENLYKEGLNMGIPKEIARIVNPVGHYSRMYAQANLRNWLSFLTLRQDPAAQKEIRLYADVVAAELEKLFPRTMELFSKHK